MATVKGRPTEATPLHRILREIYRRYPEFHDHVMRTGAHVIDHSYFIYEDDGKTIKEKIEVTISFFDLRDGLNKLSKRKREAVFFNVIMDWKQKDVAERMGITTVSVGQYVEQGMLQLVEDYFAETLATKSSEDSSEQESKRGRLVAANGRDDLSRE